MKVFIASDHAGFADKQLLVTELDGEFDLVDLGPDVFNPSDDYPVYARKVAESVVSGAAAMGILICKSGEGMVMAANKIDGVRASLVWTEALARETRADNDSNVMSLPAGELNIAAMIRIIRVFLTTPFSGEARHKRRLTEIAAIEKGIPLK